MTHTKQIIWKYAHNWLTSSSNVHSRNLTCILQYANFINRPIRIIEHIQIYVLSDHTFSTYTKWQRAACIRCQWTKKKNKRKTKIAGCHMFLWCSCVVHWTVVHYPLRPTRRPPYMQCMHVCVTAGCRGAYVCMHACAQYAFVWRFADWVK